MTHQSTSSALLELAEKVEKATADEQRPLIERAWDLLKPRPDVGTPDYASWGAELRRVTRLLDHGGYLDAALTLVPEGCDYDLLGRTATLSVAVIYTPDQRRKQVGSGRTPALALCAAALRYRATGAEE